ncbi:hypothetical protein D3C81_2039540 [compost metagenome]
MVSNDTEGVLDVDLTCRTVHYFVRPIGKCYSMHISNTYKFYFTCALDEEINGCIIAVKMQ